MRHLAAVTLAAMLAATAARAAEPAATPEKPLPTSTTADGLIKLLDQEKLTYQRDGERLRRTYSFTDDRSQQVFLQPLSDVRDVGVVEIYSWVMPLKAPMAPALAKRLLEANGLQKLGYFGIEVVEGKEYVFCYHNLPTKGLDSKALAAAMITVAEMADEMEKEQLGAASDDY